MKTAIVLTMNKFAFYYLKLYKQFLVDTVYKMSISDPN